MSNIVKYSNSGIDLGARIEDGQAWLTSDQAAQLFECTPDNIRKHARQIIQENELDSSTVSNFPTVASDGKTYIVDHFNQDMVSAIGRRIRRNKKSKELRGVVYFVEALGTGLVKVGKTYNLCHRLASLQTISPVRIRLIKSIPGYTEKESELHARWQKHRDHGEWFKLAPIRREILAMQHEAAEEVAV